MTRTTIAMAQSFFKDSCLADNVHSTGGCAATYSTVDAARLTAKVGKLLDRLLHVFDMLDLRTHSYSLWGTSMGSTHMCSSCCEHPSVAQRTRTRAVQQHPESNIDFGNTCLYRKVGLPSERSNSSSGTVLFVGVAAVIQWHPQFRHIARIAAALRGSVPRLLNT